jgi:glutathione S-transferase
MKFYNSVGPNPRVVRMFMAERGIEIPREEVDLRGGENRREPYLSTSPLGQLPALVLDDGTVLTEITAICEYLDEVKQGPSLLGATPEQRAETRMWTRRVDLNIVEPMAQGYRYSDGLKLFRDRIYTIPQAADDLKQIGRKHLAWLDGQMRGKEFLCGGRFSLADVFLFPFLEFFPMVKQPLDPALTNIAAWIGRMKERPSAAA